MTDTAELIARLRDAEVGYRPHVVGKYLAEAADALSSLVRERDEALTRWKCFHCHQVFTNYHAAQVHFGKASTDDPECLRELGRLGPYLLEKSRALRAAEARATAAEAERDEAMHVAENNADLWREACKIVDEHRAENEKMREALTEISSPTQTTGLLWWQVRARNAIGGKDE